MITQPTTTSIDTLIIALKEWKCPSCGGTQIYTGYSRDAKNGRECRVCKDTEGLHPTAWKALTTFNKGTPDPIDPIKVHKLKVWYALFSVIIDDSEGRYTTDEKLEKLEKLRTLLSLNKLLVDDGQFREALSIAQRVKDKGEQKRTS